MDIPKDIDKQIKKYENDKIKKLLKIITGNIKSRWDKTRYCVFCGKEWNNILKHCMRDCIIIKQAMDKYKMDKNGKKIITYEYIISLINLFDEKGIII